MPPSRRRQAKPGRRAPRFSPTKALITAGAVAGAIATIVGLGVTVGGLFRKGPEGTLRLALQDAVPYTYGEWLSHENQQTKGMPAAELRQPGQLLTLDIHTDHFKDGAELPVRLILHDLTRRRLTRIEGDVLAVVHGKSCSCFQWMPLPRGRGRYRIEVAVYPPGAVSGEPLQTVSTDVFGAS